MSVGARLLLTLGCILLSVTYAVLVANDIGKAVAWGLGYIAIVLTIMLLVNLRKKP